MLWPSTKVAGKGFGMNMKRNRETLLPIGDARAIATLLDLHRQAHAEWTGLARAFAGQALRLWRGRPLPWARLAPRLQHLSLAVDPASGVFAYQLARALGARHIVEFGTSHGISTIYLALAVRDNGGGVVVGTERVAAKAERARENLRRAGLERFVDLRTGDAPASLQDVSGPVDLVFNDGFPDAMLGVLQLLAPRMRRGGVVLAGNVAMFPADHEDYVAWVRDPRNGFCSAGMPMRLGGEFSVKVAV